MPLKWDIFFFTLTDRRAVTILEEVNNHADTDFKQLKYSAVVTLFIEMELNSSGWSTWHEIGKKSKKEKVYRQAAIG